MQIKYQKAIFSYVGCNVDFKFEVVSAGRGLIVREKAFFVTQSGREIPIANPHVEKDIDGKVYCYIKLFDIKKQDGGKYIIEVYNEKGYSTASSMLFVDDYL